MCFHAALSMYYVVKLLVSLRSHSSLFINALEQEHLSTLSTSRVCLEWVLSVLISSQINTLFPQRGPASVLDSLGINSSFCVLSLPETSAMETSAPRAGEKKDKMDGNGFSDLPKKPSPSETRGNTLFKTFSQAATESEFRVRCLSGLCMLCDRMSRGLAGARPGGKGGANTADEIYISKIKCHLGSRCSWLSSGPIRYQQQSEVTYSRCLIGILNRLRS